MQLRIRSLSILACVSLSLLACGRAAPDDGPVEVTLTESDFDAVPVRGPEVIDLPCAPVESCEVPRVLHVAAAGGHTFVLSQPELHELTTDSGLVLLASRGAGPGELRAPIAMDASNDGSAWVFDVARMRAVRFERGAAAQEHATLPPQFFREMRIRDGRLYALVVPPAAQLGDSVMAAILRLTPGDSVWSDTVAAFRTASDASTGDGSMVPVKLPWDPRVLWAACGDGSVVVASSDRWALNRYRDGRLQRAIVRSGANTSEISDEERESLASAYLESSPRIPSFREGLQRRLKSAPSHAMQIDALHCDSDGSVFVKHHPAFPDSVSRWDVVGVDGALQDAIRLTDDVTVFGARDGTLLGYSVDGAGNVSVISVRSTG